MKKFSKIFITFTVCTIAAFLLIRMGQVRSLSLNEECRNYIPGVGITEALSSEEENDADNIAVNTVENTADVQVNKITLSSFFHRVAVFMGVNSVSCIECFSRVKESSRSHNGQQHNSLLKENRFLEIGRKPIIYKYHSNLSLLFSRSADRYVYTVRRIII